MRPHAVGDQPGVGADRPLQYPRRSTTPSPPGRRARRRTTSPCRAGPRHPSEATWRRPGRSGPRGLSCSAAAPRSPPRRPPPSPRPPTPSAGRRPPRAARRADCVPPRRDRAWRAAAAAPSSPAHHNADPRNLTEPRRPLWVSDRGRGGTFVRWRRSIITLRATAGDDAWCTRLRTDVADDLLALGAPGSGRQRPRRRGRRLADDPDDAGSARGRLVSIWTQQSYGPHVLGALDRLRGECDRVDAYLVTESVPLPPPADRRGRAHAGLRERRAAATARRPGRAHLARALARRPHAGGDRDPVDVRLHPERRRARADAGRAADRRDRRGAVPPGGDQGPARVLRRRRRRRTRAIG